MKTVLLHASLFVVMALFTADASWAQPGRGMQMMNRNAEAVIDMLLIQDERADAIVESYEDHMREAMIEMRQEMRGRGGFRGGGGVDRGQMVQQIAQASQTGLMNALKESLTEKEMEIVQGIDMPPMMPAAPPMMALGEIEITDEEQRWKLIPLSAGLVADMPSFEPGNRSANEREEKREEWQSKLETYQKEVAALLNEDQETQWKEATAEIEEELQENRENRRRQGRSPRGSFRR